MRIYVAGASGETQYVKSLRTFYEIRTKPGDYKQEQALGRGDITRRLICDEFLENSGDWDALAMFDLDMLHPPDILERLRAHDLDMVTGHYYSRGFRHIHSVCWGVGRNVWPCPPIEHPPTSGLHEIGITGMGCVLIKRAVIEAVRDYLPEGDNPFAIGSLPEVTGNGSSLGTDFRFFTIARLLGYKLWLDADIECKHASVFWVGREMAEHLRKDSLAAVWLGNVSQQMLEKGGGVDALKTRLEAHKHKLQEILDARSEKRRELAFIEKQETAIRAVIAEVMDLIKHADEPIAGEPGGNGRFPVAADREQVLATRTGHPEASKQEVLRARQGVLQDEAKGFADALEQLPSWESPAEDS